MNIYLAGMENTASTYMIEQGMVENAFMSYYYMRNKKKPTNLLAAKGKVKRVIIDSGAHSFFTESGSALAATHRAKVKKTEETPEQYFERYLSWLIQYKDYFDQFVELDIGEVVGQAKVLEWRDRIKANGLYHKCITVMHPAVVSFDDYLRTLDESESRYVALEGRRKGRNELPYLKYLKPAYDRQIRVHIFAMTKKDFLEQNPCTSTDSVTWKAGEMYGMFYTPLDNFTPVYFGKEAECKKGKLIRLTTKYQNVSDVFGENKAGQRAKAVEISVDAHKKLQDYLTRLWASKGIVWQNA